MSEIPFLSSLFLFLYSVTPQTFALIRKFSDTQRSTSSSEGTILIQAIFFHLPSHIYMAKISDFGNT